MNSPSLFPSIPVEQQTLDTINRRDSLKTVGSTLDDATVSRLTELHANYPWMQGEALLALAQAGLDPNSVQAQQIGTAAAKVKSKSGFGWHSLGDVVKAGASDVGRALDDVGSAVGRVAKPVLRTTALGLSSLTQEAEGVVRNVAAISPEAAGAGVGAALGSIVPGVGTAIGAGVGGVIGGGLGALVDSKHIIKGRPTWELQSTGGVALEDLLSGKSVDVGSGFIAHPGKALAAEQKARETVTINGHALTPGRLLAAGIVQPGTTPYNVLSGLTDAALVMSKLDPGAFVAGETGNAIRNRNLFTDAGGLLADRPTILPEKAMQWWDGNGGRDVAQSLSDETNSYEIWKRTGRKLPLDTVRSLAQASSVPEVDSVIRPMLGAEITGKFGYIGSLYDTFHPLQNVRLAQMMPGPVLPRGADAVNQTEAAITAERWLKNVKAPPEVMNDAMANLIDNPLSGHRGAADLMDATRKVIEDHLTSGLDPEKDGYAAKLAAAKQRATDLTRLEANAGAHTTVYGLDNLDHSLSVPGMYLDDQMHGLPQPHLFSEFDARAVPLPDARDIRRVTSTWAPLLNHPSVTIPRMTLEFLQDKIWKTAALIRPALVARTMAEAQARMAAGGLDSAFSHPAAWAGWAGSRGGADMLGNEFAYKNENDLAEGLDAFNKAMNRKFVNPGDVKVLPFWREAQQAEPGFDRAVAGATLKLESDPIARQVARATDGLDAIKQSFWDGPLSDYRNQMAQNAGGLASRDVADRYIDSVADRLVHDTGGDHALMQAVATGKINGEDLRSGLQASKALVDHAAQIATPPNVLGAPITIAEANGLGQKFDNAGRYMFSQLMAVPQNKLVNQVTFKQLYWQRGEQLIPAMAGDAREALIAQARAQGLPDAADRMAKIAATVGAAANPITLEHADAIAKGDALEGTWKLLHRLSERGQFFDAAKLVAPFGDAWSQMLHKWARIGIEHPETIRRAQQVVQGGRDAGFFTKNAQGQEVFSYPGSGWISDHLFGVPVPLTGRLDGLSMMTDVLPGVGPVVQVPAAALLPDKPEWDWARSALFPAGEPDTKAGVAEAFLPAWAQKMRQAGVLTPLGIHRDNAQWNGAVLDVARYLSSTGKYDTHSVDGMNHLMDDARTKAKYVYLMRGATQFVAPAAPTPRWEVDTVDQKTNALHLTVVDKLVKEYHDLQQKDPQNATQQMLDKYGDGIFLLLQGKTAEVTPGAVSAVGADWEKAHAGLVKSFPEVAGLFAPDDGTLDSAAFQRQLDLGNRVSLTPEQAGKLANNRLAATIFHNASDKIGPYPNTAQRAWLGQLRDLLTQQYPGYGDEAGIPQKASPQTLLAQVTAAANDPRLTNNPAAIASKTYLLARDKASEIAKNSGLSAVGFATSKKMAATRDWLRQIGSLLVQQHPEFQQVWDRVFSRELVDDNQQGA